ncbi:MAG: hypothetical protein HKN21_05290, partial [Candidatus Eisenbacteria bacterium]|nr:hypothetical protein [Candidatus Eisenbacteria bacterium]
PQPSLTFGVGADILVYGSETTKVRLPLVEDFELNTDNNLAGFFLFGQYRPFAGPIQPYVEGRVGFNYFWTESKLEDKDFFDDGEVARETNYDDFTTFYGGGGGILIQLSEGNRVEGKPGVFLDLKATYLQGGEAEYLTEGDIEIINDIPVFNASKSETDRATYEIGVVLTF